MTSRIKIPAISPELSFMSRHWSIVEDLFDTNRDDTETNVAKRALRRANEHAALLFKEIESRLEECLSKLVDIEWVNTDRGDNWSTRARLFTLRRRSRIGTAGVEFNYDEMAMRLTAWAYPIRGGLDGRKQLVRVCRQRIPIVCLPCDHPKKYPGLDGDDTVIWFDRTMSTRVPLDTLVRDIGTHGKAFFRIAIPILTSLAKK